MFEIANILSEVYPPHVVNKVNIAYVFHFSMGCNIARIWSGYLASIMRGGLYSHGSWYHRKSTTFIVDGVSAGYHPLSWSISAYVAPNQSDYPSVLGSMGPFRWLNPQISPVCAAEKDPWPITKPLNTSIIAFLSCPKGMIPPGNHLQWGRCEVAIFADRICQGVIQYLDY